MPSAKKKELSLAKNLGELNKLAQIKDKISKNANPRTWINSAEKVYKKAVDNDVMGDEENAYVFYMRFMNIMQEVTKTAKYQQDKKYYNSIMGRSTLTRAISQAEKLSESLAERYEKREQEIKERDAKEKEKNEKENSDGANRSTSNTLQDIDDLLNGKKTSSQTSADVYKKLQVNHSSILSPSDKKSNEKDPFKQAATKLKTSPVIDPVTLYQLLNTDDVLVLDTRSKKEFESSRINFSCCINIPDDLLKTRVTVGSIERKLPKSTWNQWIERGSKGRIVILDQNTKFQDLKPDSKIQSLKDAIYLYDTSCSLQSEPVFLDGGYEAWLWHYPSLVTNPTLPKQVLPSDVKNEFNFDSISYPELLTISKPPSSDCTKPSVPSNPRETLRESPAGMLQNVPSAATKPANPSSVVNHETTPRPNSLAPKVRPEANNTTQEITSHLPKMNATTNTHFSNTVPGTPITHQEFVTPQGHLSPQEQNFSTYSTQPGIRSTPVAPTAHAPSSDSAQVAIPRQIIPNQQKLPQNSGEVNLSNSQSQTTTSLATNQPQTPMKQVSQNVPQSMIPPVASNVIPSNSTVSMPVTPTVPVNQVPSIPPAPINQRPPPSASSQVNDRHHHPAAVAQPTSHDQPSTTPHQPSSNISIAEQLRPNVSGISPKMAPKSSQPSPSTLVPQTGMHISTTSPHVPQTGSHVPPVVSPTNSTVPPPVSKPIPSVPQTFSSSRTGMTHGLPPGWERVLDRKTGRYYFRDHNTKSTHWNLPESLTQTMNRSIMGNNTTTVKEAEAKKPSLKRSLSSPNLAKVGTEETKASSSTIAADRPRVNRRTKPLTESQLANLGPSHGGQGKALTGLRNLGNSCYMNSVLQCLIATAPLAKYILNAYYLEDINKTNPLGTGGRIAEELAVLTRVAHSGNYRHVSPVEFKRTIGRFAPEFGGTKQQDSQEFLLVLLDQFHEDTNRVIKKAYIEEKSNDGLPDSMAARLAWENHKKRNQSIIVELLQGQFKSTLTCSICHKQSVTFDAFMSLTLPIPTNASCQIEDCIKLFTTKEKVSKDNKWFCPRCKQHREAWKTMEIWKLPPILIVHFNRFKRDFDGSWLEKRQTNVDFPRVNFDLSRFVLGPNKSLRYNLYGVSNHFGSMQSGHYTAFCRNIYDNKWYKFDDNDVTSMSESSVKSSAAYILCYTSMEFFKP